MLKGNIVLKSDQLSPPTKNFGAALETAFEGYTSAASSEGLDEMYQLLAWLGEKYQETRLQIIKRERRGD